MFKNISTFLNEKTSAAPLLSFRLIFGALLVISTLRFMYLGWIEDHYVEPLFHFHYWGFSWIPIFSKEILYAIHILLIISAIGIMFLSGWAYRVAAILLFLSFTYTELIDLSYYLNHYYFVSLICFILIFLPANISLFADLSKQKVRRSALLILQFQIAVLYIYAGLAKINHDWLIEALPLKIWLPANDTIPILGPLFAWKLSPYLFSWFGMLYDTFIIFFLLYSRTRIFAYLTVIIFHLLTGILFQIGVFPLVMMGITTLFFSTQWHIRFIRTFVPFRNNKTLYTSPHPSPSLFHYGLLLFIVFQLVIPWRYLLYPGNLFWTEEGYRFSWRVMLMEKAGTATFYVKDTQTGREGVVVNSDFLNIHQEKQMAMQPDMILQFAHFLGQEYEKRGVYKPEVRAEVYVTLNARPSQLLIDPNRDLMKEHDLLTPKNWILPYQK